MKNILPLFVIAFLMIGCASYNFKNVEIGLESGNPENAYNYLKKNSPQKPDIPFQYELGLVAHYADLFSESSKAFEESEMIAEDRFTKSLSKEAFSLITTDNVRPYPGTQYERLLSHYYSALNYIYADNLDGALVECRRATNLIQYFKGEDEEDYNYFGAGFLAHFCGMVFEASGGWNNALISFKQAEEYYKGSAEMTGVPIPKDVGNSLVRLSRRLNFTDDYERYLNQYGEPPSLTENHGELILFYETGYVPQKVEESLTFPILKVDKFGEEDNDDSIKFARTLHTREGMVVEEVELEYLLRVAIPIIYSNRPVYNGIRVSAGGETASGVLVEDVETLAIETLNSQRGIIIIRTLVRALGKYLLTKKAKEQNKILGVVVNLAGAIVESADTRSWQTLPNQIYMVRMSLPEGNHKISLSFLDVDGLVRDRMSIKDVKITSDQITFFNFRTYD